MTNIFILSVILIKSSFNLVHVETRIWSHFISFLFICNSYGNFLPERQSKTLQVHLYRATSPWESQRLNLRGSTIRYHRAQNCIYSYHWQRMIVTDFGGEDGANKRSSLLTHVTDKYHIWLEGRSARSLPGHHSVADIRNISRYFHF